MRNWNHTAMVERWILLPVFIVPMRNWNLPHCPKPAQFLNPVFIVPMRNWNFDVENAISIGEWYLFLSYLWGIETRTFYARRVHLRRVFIVPMRNWNHGSTTSRTSALACFYRTYEELKPVSHIWLSCLLIVFIVPMRNWNCNDFEFFVTLTLGFYRTYEELKQP